MQPDLCEFLYECLKNLAGKDWEDRATGEWSKPQWEGTVYFYLNALQHISYHNLFYVNWIIHAASWKLPWAVSYWARAEIGHRKRAQRLPGNRGLSYAIKSLLILKTSFDYKSYIFSNR